MCTMLEATVERLMVYANYPVKFKRSFQKSAHQCSDKCFIEPEKGIITRAYKAVSTAKKYALGNVLCGPNKGLDNPRFIL